MKKYRLLLFAAAISFTELLAPDNAAAQASFSVSGDSLTLTLSAPINFVATTAGDTGMAPNPSGLVVTGSPAPTDPAAMPLLATDTKPPYRADLDAADVAKTAYYAMRWVNTRGQPGPWSAISGYLIN